MKFITKNPYLLDVLNSLDTIAKTDEPVLIYGETGTGKELIAKSIKSKSKRNKENFVPINCSLYSEGLFESELFGYERGSFTGAITSKNGKLNAAIGGTIFLDEVSSMKIENQAKLLRLLEENKFYKLGTQVPTALNVRFISSVNIHPLKLLQQNQLRKDLYYRLNTIEIHISPLRNRPEDIVPLIEYFLIRSLQFTDDTIEYLMSYTWPGNVRELKNLIRKLEIFINPNSTIYVSIIKKFLNNEIENKPEMRIKELNLEELEKNAIITALERSNGIQKDACKLLGITPRALNYKIHHQYHISWKQDV